MQPPSYNDLLAAVISYITQVNELEKALQNEKSITTNLKTEISILKVEMYIQNITK
jgi:hypothetical protein